MELPKSQDLLKILYSYDSCAQVGLGAFSLLVREGAMPKFWGDNAVWAVEKVLEAARPSSKLLLLEAIAQVGCDSSGLTQFRAPSLQQTPIVARSSERAGPWHFLGCL